MASFGSLEYFLGNIKRPSDLDGSELNPIIGLSLANKGQARLALNKNVPSPPIGTITSAQRVCFVVSVTLRLKEKTNIIQVLLLSLSHSYV